MPERSVQWGPESSSPTRRPFRGCRRAGPRTPVSPAGGSRGRSLAPPTSCARPSRRLQTGGEVYSTLAVADGTVYIGSLDNFLDAMHT
ncbi:PQQ-binding-like beta-propeller repeat protein [Streptomyces sp. NBC_00986]|uniref:PQQ-binding-like beta-propeller repeat protein n=1 Tax=Streptomyces sp. NBC_00986 TaxID=2903702 RepID=UPI00386D1694